MSAATAQRPIVQPAEVDPIVLQIVEGTLNSIEAEIEYAIERTARSPMIREAHDYRVGLFDRHCRKLTGRSYSAMPNAVVRDFPLDSMKPGDVFLMNDTYLTEGSIGHLPDLCSTVPVFHDGKVVALIQAFGHHDDIGGRVPGSMPGTATSVFEEGLAVPPIKLYDAGVRNDAVLTIVRRNTRVPDMLAADLDSEVQACVMGARRMAELFERFGTETVEACFQAILDKCATIFRTELLPKIADGEYAWEDYVEHDGVSAPRLHKLALKMIKRGDRITLDFTGTDPQSPGPINWPADYAGGAFLIKWIAPILRNLADTPERAAEIHINEGVCEVFDVVFPPKGMFITPVWPAATNARSFVLLRCLGLLAGVVAQAVDGRMPADQETIRYTGFFGADENGKPFLSREVIGGGSGGRSYADGNDAIHIVPDSRNQPAEFTETRFPLLVEKLALRTDSGGAGQRRGGLGYEKHYRALVDCRTIVTADRVRLGCYGLNGGKAGAPFCVTVDIEGAPRDLGGLVDGEPVLAGQVVRVCTTGGGGWGDPLARETEMVLRDVIDGKVSAQAALDDYGVVLGNANEVDTAATALRDILRTGRPATPPMIDRGPGYEMLREGKELGMAIEVAKVELKTVQDASGLEDCITSGRFTADEVIAVIGKTEGNGGVNDFTRILADQAFRRTLMKHGKRSEAAINAIPMVWSGGCDGVITPHATIFARNDKTRPASQLRVAIGTAMSAELKPEDIGRPAMVEKVADAVKAAMRDAGIDDPNEVHYVQTKTPLLTIDTVRDAESRGQHVACEVHDSMGVSNGTTALGIAVALGEIKMPRAEEICKNLDLYSAVASCSSGVELTQAQIVLLGNKPGAGGRFRIGHAVMRDALDIDGIYDSIRSAGLTLPDRPRAEDLGGRVVNCFMKCEADRRGTLRGRRQIMLDDSDVHHHRHSKAAVGGVAAAAIGDPAVFVSVDAMHQGPQGGGPVIAIVDAGE